LIEYLSLIVVACSVIAVYACCTAKELQCIGSGGNYFIVRDLVFCCAGLKVNPGQGLCCLTYTVGILRTSKFRTQKECDSTVLHGKSTVHVCLSTCNVEVLWSSSLGLVKK